MHAWHNNKWYCCLVQQAQFDEEEIILGPNDDENLAVNNTVPTDAM